MSALGRAGAMSVASTRAASTRSVPQTVIAFNQPGVTYGLPCSAFAAGQDSAPYDALYLFYAVDMVTSVAPNCDRIDMAGLTILVSAIVHGKHVEVSGVRHGRSP